MSSLGPLLPGDEECTQGGTELPRVETAELSGPEALAAPRAEHPAHDGPHRTDDTESGLARKRGREFQGGQRGQQLKSHQMRGDWGTDYIYIFTDKFNT